MVHQVHAGKPASVDPGKERAVVHGRVPFYVKFQFSILCQGCLRGRGGSAGGILASHTNKPSWRKTRPSEKISPATSHLLLRLANVANCAHIIGPSLHQSAKEMIKPS